MPAAQKLVSELVTIPALGPSDHHPRPGRYCGAAVYNCSGTRKSVRLDSCVFKFSAVMLYELIFCTFLGGRMYIPVEGRGRLAGCVDRCSCKGAQLVGLSGGPLPSAAPPKGASCLEHTGSSVTSGWLWWSWTTWHGRLWGLRV